MTKSSFIKVKKLAQRVIKKYSLAPPIDIKEVLERYAKCVEDALPNNADAICIINISRPLVILNRFNPVNRKRFTLAHELGHIIIPWHSGMISCHTEDDEDINENSYQLMEAEANKFAAEILMPTEWLKNMILKYEKNGLEELIYKISLEAQVSLSAAFYSLLEHLNCYIIRMKNNELNFENFKKTNGINFSIPRQNGEYDKNWLDHCAFKKGYLEIDRIEIEWWKIPSCISEQRLKTIIEKEGDCNFREIYEEISNFGKGAFAATFETLISMLPQGFVVEVRKNDYRRLYQSTQTNISVPFYSYSIETLCWFLEMSNKSGNFVYNGYEYFWGYFKVEVPLLIQNNDDRLSKEILKDILKDCYESPEIRDKMSRKINGTIGALNNNRELKDFEEFFIFFKMRFLGQEDLNKVVNHPYFDSFVVNKTKELIAKRS